MRNVSPASWKPVRTGGALPPKHDNEISSQNGPIHFSFSIHFSFCRLARFISFLDVISFDWHSFSTANYNASELITVRMQHHSACVMN